jgi:hypothetical protein
VTVAPVPAATARAKPSTPIAAIGAEPKGLRIDGDLAEWDVPVASTWTARLAMTPAALVVAGRMPANTKAVYVSLQVGSQRGAPLVRTRDGYRWDVECEAVFSGASLAQCKSSLVAQQAKLGELHTLLEAEYELASDGVRTAGRPAPGSTGAVLSRGESTTFELRVPADDLPWISELPVRSVQLGVGAASGAPTYAKVTLPAPVSPGARSGKIAELLWPSPIGATSEARAHVFAIYRASEAAPALRFLELDGPKVGGAATPPPMKSPVIVDTPVPSGRTLASSGDVEIQERTALGRRVVTSHKAGIAVDTVLIWDAASSKVRKSALRPQGIDVLVEIIDEGEPGPPDVVALRVLRAGADGRVKTMVDFGNPFLKSERFEDATLSSFGIRGKGWRPREFADLDLHWLFDPATGTYTERHSGF